MYGANFNTNNGDTRLHLQPDDRRDVHQRRRPGRAVGQQDLPRPSGTAAATTRSTPATTPTASPSTCVRASSRPSIRRSWPTTWPFQNLVDAGARQHRHVAALQQRRPFADRERHGRRRQRHLRRQHRQQRPRRRRRQRHRDLHQHHGRERHPERHGYGRHRDPRRRDRHAAQHREYRRHQRQRHDHRQQPGQRPDRRLGRHGHAFGRRRQRPADRRRLHRHHEFHRRVPALAAGHHQAAGHQQRQHRDRGEHGGRLRYRRQPEHHECDHDSARDDQRHGGRRLGRILSHRRDGGRRAGDLRHRRHRLAHRQHHRAGRQRGQPAGHQRHRARAIPAPPVNDDAYITYTFAAAGTYYIRVGRFISNSVAQPMLAGQTYTAEHLAPGRCRSRPPSRPTTPAASWRTAARATTSCRERSPTTR